MGGRKEEEKVECGCLSYSLEYIRCEWGTTTLRARGHERIGTPRTKGVIGVGKGMSLKIV